MRISILALHFSKIKKSRQGEYKKYYLTLRF